jgi:hypothetical protein
VGSSEHSNEPVASVSGKEGIFAVVDSHHGVIYYCIHSVIKLLDIMLTLNHCAECFQVCDIYIS